MASTASISAPSPPTNLSSYRCAAAFSFPVSLEPKNKPIRPPKGLFGCRDGAVRAMAHKNEVVGGPAVGGPSPKAPGPKENEMEKPKPPPRPISEEAISAFMTQVASLVKLVDSKDIVELELKQTDFELTIRKKEALPQAPAPVVMMHGPSPPAAMPSYAPPPPAAASPSPASPASALEPAPAPASAPKAAKSSHPPFKSPMSGTFYRSPGPGLPPFVKPGDRVNKGQVVCIIEAMKLMNEIEADHAGTVVEILADDGKPVGVDQPIFIIEP